MVVSPLLASSLSFRDGLASQTSGMALPWLPWQPAVAPFAFVVPTRRLDVCCLFILHGFVYTIIMYRKVGVYFVCIWATHIPLPWSGICVFLWCKSGCDVSVMCDVGMMCGYEVVVAVE